MPPKSTISSRVERICVKCDKHFLVYPSRLRQAAAKFCSMSCYRHLPLTLDWLLQYAEIGEGQQSCWLWMRHRDRDGYGRIRRNRKDLRVHIVAWQLSNRVTVPPGLLVLHRCDNPPCFRPDHLFTGTTLDNNRDKVRKGRSASGDRHHARLHPELLKRGSANVQAKLTEESVRIIRMRLNEGATQQSLANEFGVSQPVISSIALRKRWKHVE